MIYKTYTYKTKDRVTRTPLKPEGEFRCSGKVSSSSSTSDIRQVNIRCRNVIHCTYIESCIIRQEWSKNTMGMTRSCASNDRLNNDQKKTNRGSQNTSQKAKNCAAWNTLKPRVTSDDLDGIHVAISAPIVTLSWGSCFKYNNNSYSMVSNGGDGKTSECWFQIDH